MGIANKIPGMRPGSWIRNIVVGVVYVFGVLMILGALAGEPDDTSNGSEAEPESGAGEEAEAEDVEEEVTDVEEEEDADAAEIDSSEDEIEEEAEDEQEFTDEELLTLFETVVIQQGVELESAEFDGDTLDVEYTSVAQDEGELVSEMGALTGAYAGIVDRGHSSDRMDVTILNAAGQPAATFHAESDWAEAYMNDEMSDEEYAERVLDTLEAEEENQAAVAVNSHQVIA